MLEDIFLSDRIATANGCAYSVPNKKRLYVFEEIDCGQWGKIVTPRGKALPPPVRLPVDDMGDDVDDNIK